MAVNDPSDPYRQNHPETISRNARYGMILFLIYLAFYAGFVWLTAFRPKVMAQAVVGGVNLAVVYGFSLIGIAFVMALIYMYLCRNVDHGNGGAK